MRTVGEKQLLCKMVARQAVPSWESQVSRARRWTKCLEKRLKIQEVWWWMNSRGFNGRILLNIMLTSSPLAVVLPIIFFFFWSKVHLLVVLKRLMGIMLSRALHIKNSLLSLYFIVWKVFLSIFIFEDLVYVTPMSSCNECCCVEI